MNIYLATVRTVVKYLFKKLTSHFYGITPYLTYLLLAAHSLLRAVFKQTSNLISFFIR